MRLSDAVKPSLLIVITYVYGLLDILKPKSFIVKICKVEYHTICVGRLPERKCNARRERGNQQMVGYSLEMTYTP